MADLLKNTIEKKETRIRFQTWNLLLPSHHSSHYFSGSAPLLFHKEEPNFLHLLKTKEIPSPHWWSWFNSLLSVTSSVKTPNTVQVVTETNPKALQILLCRGVSHLSCHGDLNPNNVKITSKTTDIFFEIKNYHQNNPWLYVQSYLKGDEIQIIWKLCYYREWKSAVLNKL